MVKAGRQCSVPTVTDRSGNGGRDDGISLCWALKRLRQWARTIKRDVLMLSLAAHDPRVPWYAKVVAAGVAAYALSPIDFIPDFIPVLGYLDDVIIVPLGIVLAIRLFPRPCAKNFDARP